VFFKHNEEQNFHYALTSRIFLRRTHTNDDSSSPYRGSRQSEYGDVSTILKQIFGEYRPTVRTVPAYNCLKTISNGKPTWSQPPYFVLKGTTKKCDSTHANAFFHLHIVAVEQQCLGKTARVSSVATNCAKTFTWQTSRGWNWFVVNHGDVIILSTQHSDGTSLLPY
jgi:hypothetical protein